MVSLPKDSWGYNVFAKYFTKTCEDRVSEFDFKQKKYIRMTCIVLVAKLDHYHKKKLHLEMLLQRELFKLRDMKKSSKGILIFENTRKFSIVK